MWAYLPPCLFAGTILFFHASEFSIQWVFNRAEVNFSNLLLIPQYLIALACGCTEYAIEYYFFPHTKLVPFIVYTGLAFVIFGEFWRKGAMIQAGMAFTHDIKYVKREGHKLVKTGFYRYVRHPGYFGWFIWSVSTQIMLTNPICTILYAIVSWNFFADRIPVEEALLIRMFGDAYVEYKSKTPTRIPFIA